MKKMSKAYKLNLLSAALIPVFGSALAAEDEVAQYVNPDSIISIGAGNWSGDRDQAAILDGTRDHKTQLLLDADVVKRDNATGTWFKLKVQNLGLDSRDLRLDLERQGDVGGYIGYSKTPYDNPYTIYTSLQGIGHENLTVGSNAGAFPIRKVELGTERELWSLGGFKNLMPGVDLKVDFKTEDKTGTRQAGMGSAPQFSVEPIDSTTRQFEVILRYTGKEFQLSGGYNGTWYDNHNSLIMQRLNGITGGTNPSFASLTPISLPLDNEAHQLFLDGGYAFSPTTHGNFKLSYTHATQDQRLPSYNLTGANARFVGAPSSLNGEVNTTLVQLGLISRPLPKLTLTANLRYNDVDEKTPVRGFVGSNGTGVATVFNTPQSYTTTVGKLEAAYNLPENFKVIGGLDYSTQDRSHPKVGEVYVPYRDEVDETTYRVALRRAMSDNLNGTISYLRSDRDGSRYLPADATDPFSNEINPFNIADRKRDKWRLTIDWAPLSQLDMQFRFEDSQDEYPGDGRPYGLKDGSATLYAIDASYTLPNDWKLSAWYSNDTTKVREVTVRAPRLSLVADAVKESHLRDETDAVGINLRGNISAKIQMATSLDWYKTNSRYPQNQALVGAAVAYPANTVGPLPSVETSMIRFKLDGKYEVDKTSSFGVEYIYERWFSNDSTWNFANGSPFAYYSGNNTCTGCLPTNGSANRIGIVDGTTVTSKNTQTANFVGIRYNYKFQ